VEGLRTIKRRHEDRIKHVTGLGDDRSTVVLRVIGKLRGKGVDVGRQAVASAAIGSAHRYPRFALSYDQHGIEVDLRHVAGELTAGPSYYAAARDIIDEVIDQRLNDGITKGEVDHISVFAWARLPLLVYLGSRLDDNVPTDIYQRHRGSSHWAWPSEDEGASFSVSHSPIRDGDEAVLIVNVSGSVQPNELPAELQDLPRFSLALQGAAPHPDAIVSVSALASFERAYRQVLAEVEASYKHLRSLHVFAAAPVSAAVIMGRAWDRSVHPALVIYDRTDLGYKPAFKVGGHETA
jgi:hypothetical protein